MNETFSVSELNQFLKDILSAGMPRSFWICGEVQGYDRNKGRQHLFFELVEKDPLTNEIKARASAVIWGGVRQKIEMVLKRSENAFQIKDDIEIRVLCKLDLYVPHGAIRLIVENIDPVHTLGKISQDRQKLIAELTAAGVLEKNKALSFPQVPLRVGLVTAFDSAAYNDFLGELSGSGFSFKVFYVSSLMQGKGCESSVCAAIQTLNRRKDLDVIVVTRGGGSIAELSCFDSKAIALAVAGSRYPVLSGIGHEINTTITDLAAHTFVKTPTAAAQYLIAQAAAFDRLVDELMGGICRRASERVKDNMHQVRKNAFRLQQVSSLFFRDIRSKHVRLEEFCRNRSVLLIRQRGEYLVRLSLQLNKTIHLRLANAGTKIASIEKMIELASPVKIMRRGFSIVRNKNGRIVRSIQDARQQDILTNEVPDGIIISQVTGVSKENTRE